MALIPSAVVEEETRLDKMLAEFRAAQQRRLVKQGMALWNEAEAAYRIAHAEPPPDKAN